METRNKVWVGLGVVVAVSAAFYVGTQSEPGMQGIDHGAMVMPGEGGEGGEGASTADAISSDAIYLGQLAFIRGHLFVGVSLYRDGFQDGAVTHMKHPGDELYANLLPALASRNASGFADQLQALAAAVEGGKPMPEVQQSYDRLLDSITEAENAVKDQSASVIGAVIVNLVRTAAAEYDIAMGDDGQVEAEHEYQDSLGFMHIAQDKLDRLASMTENQDSIMAMQTQLDMLKPIWPGLRAPAKLAINPSVIYGAASRIEIATLSL